MNVWSFLLALIVVLALIGVAAWLFYKYGANRLGMSAARGRPPRLAVIDAAHVDGRRRIVLVRRDNVEHLLLIGGPTDVVVEPNIVRATAPSREAGPRPAEPVMRPAPAAEDAWPAPAEPTLEPPALPPRPAREAEAARPEPRMPVRPRPAEPRPEPRVAEPRLAERPAEPSEPGFDFPAPNREAPRRAPRLDMPPLAPRPESRPVRPPEPRPAITIHARRAPEDDAPAASAPAETTEKNLSDMAQKLEAALRRPIAPTEARPASPAASTEARPETRPAETRAADVFASDSETPDVSISTRGGAGAPRPGPTIPPAPPARPDIAQDSEPKTDTASKLFGELEQEMASLLGRPKTPS